MTTYRRKNATVEARQHEGPKIVVNSALKGNQSALAGDYLVTDPEATQARGSVYVVAKADFERDNEEILAAVVADRILQIAMVCHEANRAYCETIGDVSQPSWRDAPDWQQRSAITGVKFHLEHLEKGEAPSPSASHESWLAEKENDGWKYGPVKNPETKEHPCFVAYDKLPLDQRRKDFIFAGVVQSFFNCQV